MVTTAAAAQAAPARPVAARERRRLRRAGSGVVAIAGSVMAGVVFTALALRLGPVLALALPLGVLVFAATLRRPVAAVVLVVAALPLGDIGVGGSFQLIDVAAIFAVALVVVARVNARQSPLPWHPSLGWLVGLFLVTLASSPTSISPDATFGQELQLLTGILLVLATVGACATWGNLRAVVVALLLVGVGASIVAVNSASELRIRAGGAGADNRAVGIFTQPNQLGLFAAMVLLVAVGVAAGERSRNVRVLAVITVTGSLGALLLSLSRGAWIGALLGCLAFAVLVPDVRRRLLTGMLPVVVLALAFGAAQPENVQLRAFTDRAATLGQGGSGSAYDNRPVIWREARRQIAERPLLGFGPASFPDASARWRSEAKTGAWHAHNVLLTVGAEAGLLAVAGLVAFTLALGSAARRAIRRIRSAERRALVAGLASSLVALIGQGLVDFTLRNAVLVTFVWLVVGLLVAAIALAGRDAEATATGR